MTSSNRNIFRVTDHLCGEFTGEHKGQWRGALMFSLTCVWINDWVNNGEAGDLRRYRAHYDVTIMQCMTLNDIHVAIMYIIENQQVAGSAHKYNGHQQYELSELRHNTAIIYSNYIIPCFYNVSYEYIVPHSSNHWKQRVVVTCCQLCRHCRHRGLPL